MKFMRNTITKILKEMGFENIDQAADGQEALEMITKSNEEGKKYKLIISDWNMPNLSGIDLLSKVRDLSGFKNTPFIMVTAEAKQGNDVKAISEGVNSFVLKPFKSEALKDEIEKVLDA